MRRNRGGYVGRALVAFALTTSGVLAVGIPGPVGADDTGSALSPPVAVLGEVPLVAGTSRSRAGRVLVEVLGDNPVRAVREIDAGAEIVGAFAGMALVRTTIDATDRLARGGLTVRRAGDIGDGDVVPSIADAELLEATTPELDASRSSMPALARSRPVKIGVIGLFDTAFYSQQQARGKVPAVAASRRRCFTRGGRCPFGTKGARSGNVAAQIIWTENRSVELYLVETGGVIDVRNAIDWLAKQGVDIVQMNMTVPWDGPGDGTGPAAAVVDRAVRKGMMWVNPAGDQTGLPFSLEFRGSYWRGRWTDRDDDGWLDFGFDDEALGVRCGYLYGLRWSDWTGASTDYDLLVGDASALPNGQAFVPGNTAWRLGSRDQSGRGVAPLEANTFFNVCNRNPDYGPVIDENGDGFVAVYIQNTERTTESASGDVLELMLLGGALDQFTARSSLQSPFADSDNPGMVTVGGHDQGGPRSALGVSSHGPTNDGRIKPDLTAYGCAIILEFRRCTHEEYGGYWSTTIAAQRTAARLALHVAANDIDDPTVLRFLARRRSIPDFDQTEPSNEIGWGDLREPVAPTPVSFVPVHNVAPNATFRSPRKTRTQIDRWFKIEVPIGSDSPTGMSPGVVDITITGARRKGVIEVYGATDLPGTQVVVPIARSSGRQHVRVAVNDVGPLWVHSTTGGDIVVDAWRWQLSYDYAPTAAVPLQAPLTLRSLADPALRPSTDLDIDLPPSPISGRRQHVVVARTTVVATRAARVRVGGYPLDVPAGRSTHLHYIAVDSGSIRLQTDRSVQVQVDLLGHLSELRPRERGQFPATPTTVLAKSVKANTDVRLSFAAATDIPRSAPQVLVRVLAQSRERGWVTVRESDGVRRPLVGLNGGLSSAVVLVAVDELSAVLRSTVAARIDVTVIGYTSPGLVGFAAVEAPPLELRNAGRPAVSADGSLVAVVATGGDRRTATPETTNRLYLWDRAAGSARIAVDDSAGGKPDAAVSLVALAADGSAIAYTSRATDIVVPASSASLALYVEQIDGGSIERFSLTGVIDGADRVIGASDDLTTFVTAAGVVLRIAPDRSAIGVVRSYPSTRGLDISGDGATVLLADEAAVRVAVVDSPGGPGTALPRSTGASLSGDGTTVVTRGRVYTAAGVLVDTQCPGAADGSLSAVDADASTVVHAATCGSPMPLQAAAFVSVDGGDLVPLVPMFRSDEIPVVSADGSTVVMIHDTRLVGAFTMQ